MPSNLWLEFVTQLNGLSGQSALIEGQSLALPAGVIRNTNNVNTFQPYDPAAAIGDTSPTAAAAATPPKKKGCGGIGTFLLAIIAVAVTFVTKGATSGFFSGLFSGTSLSAGTAAAAATIATGTTAAAAGSIVSQAVGVATGIQEKFSWKNVALAAISGGVSASGFGGQALGISNPTLQAMAQGAASSAISQGIGVVTGLQDKFSWAGVAAAGVGAGVAFKVGTSNLAQGIGAKSPLAADIFISGADAIANAATRTLIDGSDFGANIAAALPSVLGNAIGRSLVAGVSEAISEATRMRAELADMKAAPLTIKPKNDRIEVDYSKAGLDPITAKMPREQGSENTRVSGQMRYIDGGEQGQGRFIQVGLPNTQEGNQFKGGGGSFSGAGSSGEWGISSRDYDSLIARYSEQASRTVDLQTFSGLVAQIGAIDPNYRYGGPQSFEGLSGKNRSAEIDGVRFDLAAAKYRLNGEEQPLRRETARFLQQSVDAAYTRGDSLHNEGKIRSKISREVAIGNYIDREVRSELRIAFSERGISFGGGQKITINNRQYANDGSYGIPDAQIGRIAIDWTLTAKSASTPQVRAFFAAQSSPRAVLIIRPSQLGPNSSYSIPRPPTPPPIVRR